MNNFSKMIIYSYFVQEVYFPPYFLRQTDIKNPGKKTLHAIWTDPVSALLDMHICYVSNIRQAIHTFPAGRCLCIEISNMKIDVRTFPNSIAD